MRRALAEERGFTLVEVLTASVLMIVVLGATLSAFNAFELNSERNQRQNDAQDQARQAMGSLAKELRNLASPTNERPKALERAEPADVVFLSVAPVRPTGSFNERNTRRVRFCLKPTSRELWRQEQNWTGATTPDVSSDAACPGEGWTSERVVAQGVVNEDRPVFSYNAGELTSITEVAAKLFVDANPGTSPKETTLDSAVFLRNQNRAPAARFSADLNGTTIVLNGSQSTDPEGKALEYYWYDEAVTTNECPTIPEDVSGTGCVGTGIILSYGPLPPGSRKLHLVVSDPAGLASTAETQTVCVPGAGVTC